MSFSVRGASALIVALAASLTACASAPQPRCLPAEVQREPESNSGLGSVPGPARGLQDCAETETLIVAGDAGLEVPAPGVIVAEPMTVKLPYGSPLTLPDGLRLEFADVIEDSRCPQGVQCVWAGRARIELVASKPGVAARLFELSLPGPQQVYLDYGIQLVALAPPPVSGRRTAQGDYVATLSITPASVVTPGRNPPPDLPR